MTNFEPRSFFPADTFGEVLDVVRIPMGMSAAAVYSVTTEKGAFILRIHGSDRQAWQQASLLQALAADHGVAPPLVMLDKNAAATISVKIDGMAIGQAVADPTRRAIILGSLADQLGALHRIPTAGISPRDSMAMSRRIWQQQSQRQGFPAWALPLQKRLDDADQVLARDQRQVFSHCDPNPTNIMWDGHRVWLVDWEVAGLAHPYLDLSIIANFLALADGTGLELLRRQEQAALNDDQEKTFATLRHLTRVVFGTVFLSLIPDLSAVKFANPADAPSLLECYGLMAAGKLRMQDPAGQAQVGTALLVQALI